MAAVLCSKFPDKAGELFAYQASIVRADRNYEGKRLVACDRQYRRQALARQDLNWSVPDPRLYNEAVTGRARPIARCSYCLQDDHAAQQCPRNPHRPNGLAEPHPEPIPGRIASGPLTFQRDMPALQRRPVPLLPVSFSAYLQRLRGAPPLHQLPAEPSPLAATEPLPPGAIGPRPSDRAPAVTTSNEHRYLAGSRTPLSRSR